MKKCIYTTIAAFLTIVFTACSNDNELKQYVQAMNKLCPYSIGDWCTLDEVDYSDGAVTMSYVLMEGLIDYEGIKANEEAFRNNTLMSYANNSDKGFVKLIDAIVKAGADMNVVYKVGSGDSILMHFTSGELKSNRQNTDANPVAFLTTTAETIRLQTPTVVDEGLVLTDVFLDAHYFTYVYDCDESEYDIDEMIDNVSVMKEAILEEALESGGTLAEKLFSTLKSSHRGLAYKYIGSSSGKICTVYIKPDEL